MKILGEDLSYDAKAEIIADEPVYLVCKESGCTSGGEMTFTPYKLGLKFEGMMSEEYPYDPLIEKDTTEYIDNNTSDLEE